MGIGRLLEADLCFFTRLKAARYLQFIVSFRNVERNKSMTFHTRINTLQRSKKALLERGFRRFFTASTNFSGGRVLGLLSYMPRLRQKQLQFPQPAQSHPLHRNRENHSEDKRENEPLHGEAGATSRFDYNDLPDGTWRCYPGRCHTDIRMCACTISRAEICSIS